MLKTCVQYPALSMSPASPHGPGFPQFRGISWGLHQPGLTFPPSATPSMGENTPLSGLNTLQWVFQQILSDLQSGVRILFSSPRPSWPVSGSCRSQTVLGVDQGGGWHRAQLRILSETETGILHLLEGKERVLKMCIRVQSFYSAPTLWLVPENSNTLGRLGLGCSQTCALEL